MGHIIVLFERRESAAPRGLESDSVTVAQADEYFQLSVPIWTRKAVNT